MTTAWMLTSPWPKPHFYEVWRFLREMRDRGLDTQHVNPEMFNVVGDNVYMNGKKIEPPDLVIMRHAVWDPKKLKDLGVLEKHGTLFVSKLLPHIDALDKIAAHEKYVKANIPLPKTITMDITDEECIEQIGDLIGWPCVIKWRFSAGSEKVFLCQNEFDVYKIASDMLRENKTEAYRRRLCWDPTKPQSKHNMICIVQEYIDIDFLITAHVVKDRNIQATMQAMPPTLKGLNKFKGNFATSEDRTQLPIRTNSELYELARKSLDALDIEWGRIDVFPTKDGLKLCEVNPSANIPFTEGSSLKNIAGHMVDHAIEKFKARR